MTYTIDEAKKILQLDEDADAFVVRELLESADEEMLEATGFDYGNNPCGLSKKYVRMTILQEYYKDTAYAKDYDFTFGRSSILTRLSLMAKRMVDDENQQR